MAERFNGNVPNKRRMHGSERRGILAPPSQNYLAQLKESKDATIRLRSSILEKEIQKKIVEPSEKVSYSGGIGNKSLPIFNHKQDLLNTIEANKATILMGATGSGKTTQLPQYLYEAGYDHTFVVEGRRVMADGNGERVQAELDVQLGKDAARNIVGIIHGTRVERHDDNKITFITANSFIRKADQIKKEYKGLRVGIITDEIHEDDPYVEIAVGVAGQMTRDEEHFRVIGASATIDADSIKKPLGRITNWEHPEQVDVPVFTVEGRPFNVEIIQAPDMDPAEAYLAYGTGHAVSILSTKGADQISAIITKVNEGLMKRNLPNVEFRKYSGETSAFQRAAIEDYAKNIGLDQRLVVVATPVARSGITIPNATFAATDGVINREIRDEDGYWGLVTEYTTQAELFQVAGRVGRDKDGAVAYICQPMPGETRNQKRIDEYKALFPFVALEDRPQYPIPSILNTNISGISLELAAIGLEHTEINKMTLTELDESAIYNVRTRLMNTFGALDSDGKITRTGKLMDQFPVVAELSRGLAEGVINGRSRQHMGRSALLAAAVDVGGIQQFRTNNQDPAWKQLLRDGSEDDFIAQLDLMLALWDAEKKHETFKDKYDYLWEYELNSKRSEDAKKMAHKILRRLGIDSLIFEIEPPSYAEIADLREDFTAGMFDSVYRDAGMVGKERMYTHVRDNEKTRFRTISERSVTEPASGQILAGIPQYYKTIYKGKYEAKDVLTMTLKVDPKIVGHFALQNRLVQYTPVKQSARMNGGMVLERENIMFGDLKVGTQDVAKSREKIPVESQRALVQYALHNPGDAQMFLRKTADELSEYRRTLPIAEINKYRLAHAPVDLTKSEIERLLRHYAQRTRNAQELDTLLGEHASQKRISIDHYYSSDARAEMLARSPETLVIGGAITDIRYSNGLPYVARITHQQEAAITGPVYLDDGREVLWQVKKEAGRGTMRISFGKR
jgi:HrpA-like RNA helicase